MKTLIPVAEGDIRSALQGFLRLLLENNVVDALLVPMRTPQGAVAPALVMDASLLSEADPLAPVMPGNAATLAGKLSIREPRAKVGAVLRACELRALVELVKLKQASLENLVLIAADCAGTLDVPRFYELPEKGRALDYCEWFEKAFASPEADDRELRLACQMCEYPTFEQADIALELLGGDLRMGIQISLPDDLGEMLGFAPVADGHARAERMERLVAQRVQKRDSEFDAMAGRIENEAGIIGVFDQCIRCHNCMTVCPICYCRTCVFKSNVFEHEPMKYISWANRKGAFRLPADTSLFHLTRLNHMVLSCVGCGMCTQACPADLPVGVVFRSVGHRVQDVFEYLPGRSVDEVLPLITFEEDEWTDLGE
jgi:formate dehydrogenase subunit beta